MTNENDRSTLNKKRKKALPPPESDIPLVGIGASAGGLEAFETFVSALPGDCGIAYILVVHLAPSHVSILSEIIQKKTKMKVSQITDNVVIEPSQIYIIPPGKDLEVFGDTLQLFDLKKPHGFNLPIDSFFHSLAKDRGSMAIGVILSGTGTDGTFGIRAIKNSGGMIMVQDLESAKHDGMPRSAISTGLVDYILAPEKMYTQLRNHLRHQVLEEDSAAGICSEKMSGALQKIFLLLRKATDHDFSLYKKNTICRRIEKRMQMQGIDTIDDYARYIEESDTEKKALFKELLIGVTRFFRDAVPFDLLKEKYLPELLKDKQSDYQLRIWVPGCSSGEEVYSIAIVVWECMAVMGRIFEVQIFGTDLDEEAINFARVGKYPAQNVADISPERLKNFFTKEEKYYRVTTNIREMVIFAPQNVIKDPPFTKIDLICCRNLLIYFGQKLQNKLFPLFHYSLKRDGLLLLGTSETISLTATDLFTVLDKKWKIYQTRPVTGFTHPVLNLSTQRPAVRFLESDEALTSNTGKDANTGGLLKAILAESNMAPCVVINDNADILYIHGRIGRFLEPAEGEVCNNILKMARPGLQAGISRAMFQLARERREIKMNGLRIQDRGGSFEVNVTVKPLANLHMGRGHLMLLIFEEVIKGDDTMLPAAPQVGQADKGEDVKRLEDQLQITIEEMEAANEELKSTNEELQSANEELQSSNEELETSKEEMQSLNEESATVNSELQSRVDELIAANDDIKNLLDATDIAAIFLDIDLLVKRFTPPGDPPFPFDSS